jgi:hypothetical protein
MYLFVYIKNWSSDIWSFEIENVRLILIVCTEQLGQMSLWSLSILCETVCNKTCLISTNESNHCFSLCNHLRPTIFCPVVWDTRKCVISYQCFKFICNSLVVPMSMFLIICTSSLATMHILSGLKMFL